MKRLVLSIALACAAPSTFAQYTSERPVRLIIPFAPGSGTDIAARILIEPLAEAIKRPVVPDNRPGALGTIGTDAAAKAAPDGHTLVMIGGSAISSAPFVVKNLPYDPLKDLVPVYLVASSPLALWVAVNAKEQRFEDLVAAARAQPGKLNFGAHVATNLVAMELVKQWQKIDLVHVRYKSAPQGLNDVAAGLVNTMFADLSGSMPLARAGKIRALALMKRTRSASAPEIPTVYELGYRGHEMINWTGIFAPARTPQGIVDQLAAELTRIAARAEVRDRFEKTGLELVQGSTPASFAEFIRAEIEAVGPIIKALGVTAD